MLNRTPLVIGGAYLPRLRVTPQVTVCYVFYICILTRYAYPFYLKQVYFGTLELTASLIKCFKTPDLGEPNLETKVLCMD